MARSSIVVLVAVLMCRNISNHPNYIVLDDLHHATEITFTDNEKWITQDMWQTQTYTGSIMVSREDYKQLARHRFTDILSRLPKGAQKRIAQLCNCAPSTVSNVLNGKQTQHSYVAINIIRVAEQMCRRS